MAITIHIVRIVVADARVEDDELVGGGGDRALGCPDDVRGRELQGALDVADREGACVTGRPFTWERRHEDQRDDVEDDDERR